MKLQSGISEYPKPPRKANSESSGPQEKPADAPLPSASKDRAPAGSTAQPRISQARQPKHEFPHDNGAAALAQPRATYPVPGAGATPHRAKGAQVDSPSNGASRRVPATSDPASDGAAMDLEALHGQPARHRRAATDTRSTVGNVVAAESKSRLQKIAAAFPFIRAEASAFATKHMADVGLAGLDPDTTMLVRFSRPSRHRLETNIKPSGMAVRQSVDIEQQWSMTEVLTKGFPRGYGANRMGATKGEFGVYAKAELNEKSREWATATKDVIQARASYDPDASFDGFTSASLVDSAQLYSRVSTLKKDPQQNFARVYGNTLRTFWEENRESYAGQQRNVAFQLAADALENGMSPQDFDAAHAGLSGRKSDRYTVSPVVIGGYKALDSLAITDKQNGRSVLYVPGSPAPWKGFADSDGARRSILEQVAGANDAARFANRHFSQIDVMPDAQGKSVLVDLRSLVRRPESVSSSFLKNGQPLVGNPFSQLARASAAADLYLAGVALRKPGTSLLQFQRRQQTQWQSQTHAEPVANLPKANPVSPAVPPISSKGTISRMTQPVPMNALAVPPVQNLPRTDTSASVHVPSTAPAKKPSEDSLELHKQYPGFLDAASRYATSYLRKYGSDIDPDKTWMLRLTGPERPVLPFNNPDMAFYSTPLHQNIYTGDPALPNHPLVRSPSQLTDKRSLTDVFLRNFDPRDTESSIANKKSIFGAYTDADLLKPNLAAATQAEFDQWSNSDSAKPDAKDVATSRVDIGQFYRDMQRAPDAGGNDFVNTYLGEMKTFWKNNTERYVRVQKENANAVLEESAKRGEISAADRRLLEKGFSGKGSNDVQVYPLAIGGHESINALRILDRSSGRTALYLPGEKRPFELFSSIRYAKNWIDRRSKDQQWASDFAIAHFSGSEATNAFRKGSVKEFLSETLHRPFSNDFNLAIYYPSPLSSAEKIKGDPFSYLATSHHKKDLADIVNLNTSNTDRRDLMLSMRLKGIPFIGKEAALWYAKGKERDQLIADVLNDVVLTGTSYASVEKLEQAANASVAAVRTVLASVQGRDAGDAAAGLVLNTLKSLTAQRKAAESAAEFGARGLTIQSAAHEAEKSAAAVAGSAAVQQNTQYSFARPAFDSSVSLTGETPNANGVYTINGKQYISLDGGSARIQGLADANQRAILTDEQGNPLSGVHVQRGSDGTWKIPSLKGGGIMRMNEKSLLQNAGGPPTIRDMYAETFSDEEFFAVAAPSTSTPNVPLLRGIVIKNKVKDDLLTRDADDFFQRYIRPNRPPFNLPATGADGKALLKDVFKDSDGVFIGEKHPEVASKKFLINNMPELRRLGVSTIYAELSDDFIGQDLERFNSGVPMTKRLDEYLNKMPVKTPDSRYQAKNVVIAARENGIDVKAMDTLSAKVFQPDRNYGRIKNMNYYAYRKILEDQKNNPGKWLAWGGAGHSDNFNVANIPPLGELLNIPSIRIADAPLGAAASFSVDPGVNRGNTNVKTANDWLLKLP